MENINNKITYHKVGDYLMPDLEAPKNIKNFRLGKYGRLRLQYLKEHKRGEYTCLMLENKLQTHLMEIEKVANDRLNFMIKQLAEKENVNEELKQNNQLEWVQLMNNIKSSVEEIILKELIFV